MADPAAEIDLDSVIDRLLEGEIDYWDHELPYFTIADRLRSLQNNPLAAVCPWAHRIGARCPV